MPGEKSARRRGVLLVLTATVLWSLAGIFARLLSHLDVWTVLGWRALLGSISISLVGVVEGGEAGWTIPSPSDACRPSWPSWPWSRSPPTPPR